MIDDELYECLLEIFIRFGQSEFQDTDVWGVRPYDNPISMELFSRRMLATGSTIRYSHITAKGVKWLLGHAKTSSKPITNGS